MKSVPTALHPFLPANPLPIVLIGAGGVVRAAHLPAYQKSNFPVTAVYDLNLDRAKALAAEFGIPHQGANGLLMNYPEGEADFLECCTLDSAARKSAEWKTVPCEGSWFPDGFIGTMGSLQQYVQGSRDSLTTSVEDAICTMAAVEAAMRSHKRGSEPIPRT